MNERRSTGELGDMVALVLVSMVLTIMLIVVAL